MEPTKLMSEDGVLAESRKQTNNSPSSDSSSTAESSLTASETSSFAPQHYYQRRFDGSKRRHELLERLTRSMQPTNAQTPNSNDITPVEVGGLYSPDPSIPLVSNVDKPPAPTLRQTNHPTKPGGVQSNGNNIKGELDGKNEYEVSVIETQKFNNLQPHVPRQALTVNVDDDAPCTPPATKRQPLHIQNELTDDRERSSTSEIRYYRVVFRGVVALLDDSISNNGDQAYKKSGAYLSYGEVIASGSEELVVDHSAPLESTQRQKHPSPRLGSAVTSPVFSQVWEQRQSQQHGMENLMSSPPRSLDSGIGTPAHLNNMRIAAKSMPKPASIDTALTVNSTNTATPIAFAKPMRKLIRVDRVLTGGYAIDAYDSSRSVSGSAENGSSIDFVKSHAMTPKRGNTQFHPPLLPNGVIAGPAPVPISDCQLITAKSKESLERTWTNESESQEQRDPGSDLINSSNIHPTIKSADVANYVHGYIFSEQSRVPIVSLLPIAPTCEQGTFQYRVISSTPIPILTGPCIDAPRTRAILIPGTVHEVCLKVVDSNQPDTNGEITFLRLTRRRGWVADRKLSTMNAKTTPSSHSSSIDMPTSRSSWIFTMKQVSDNIDVNVPSRMTMASTVATPVAAALSRHRPPRRKRGVTKQVIDSHSLPMHVLGPSVTNTRYQNDTSALTDNSFPLNSSNASNHDPRAIISPSSNISLLSDESSSLDPLNKSHGGGPFTPDRSVARSASSNSNHHSFFLMRVNAPRGLKILDAPHFQVNHLIHGSQINAMGSTGGTSTSSYSPLKESFSQGGNHSIFQTMAGHHTTTMASKTSSPAVFDSITKARRIPRGAVFEASKRLETSNVISQGAGLIKLSDNSGWAIIPRQQELDDQYRTYSGSLASTKEGEATRAFEEVGNAIIDDQQTTVFLRILSKGGISVALPPLPSSESDVETSPTSSTTTGSSALSGIHSTLLQGQILSQDSDVTSSVGSSFLDAMFRTPTKKNRESESHDSRRDSYASSSIHHHPPSNRAPFGERGSTVIPCGMCVEVDRWLDPADSEHHSFKTEYARLRGGQGWIPRYSHGKPVVETISPPESRFGSFWFRVQEQRGIKVRLGPSRRAPSIKSDDGVYFRFECGEFLRSSEIMTIFQRNSSVECFAKLYRNRHVRLHTDDGEPRSLASLTAQAEWVQVFGNGELYLEECATEPRIERHRQGWRYNVVLDARVSVRIGPSFSADTIGVVLLGGESVLINERVTGPGESVSWLRLKDGQGWVHNYGQQGESLMIPHSLRHRNKTVGGRAGRSGRDGDVIAYNTIIARLFHGDIPGDHTTNGNPLNDSHSRDSSRRDASSNKR